MTKRILTPIGEKHELYDMIQYTKTMLITGFLKSTIGTMLIGLGSAILAYSFIQPGYTAHAPYVGIILILLGCIIYFIGDIYKMRKKNEELHTTEALMDKKIEDNALTEEKARLIAKKLIRKELDELEDVLCDDGLDTLCDEKQK
jgi:hypothetical protein